MAIKRQKPASRPFGRMTLKEQNFVTAYVETCNAAEAYRRAYDCASMSPASIHSEAWRMLAKPKIRAAVAQLQASHRKRHDVTVDRILLELARIGYSDIRNVVTWGPAVAVRDPDDPNAFTIANGVALRSPEDLSPDVAASIAEISQTKEGTLKIKLHDKGKALTDMQRYLGMHKDAGADDAAAVATPDAPRETGADHLEGLAKRYAGGLKVVQGGKGA